MSNLHGTVFSAVIWKAMPKSCFPPPNCHFYYPKIHNCWLNDAISFTFILLYSFYTTLAQFNFKMCLYTTRKTWLGHPTVWITKVHYSNTGQLVTKQFSLISCEGDGISWRDFSHSSFICCSFQKSTKRKFRVSIGCTPQNNFDACAVTRGGWRM